jgi:outer membrane lipoprotein-sorting protein
MLLTKRIILTLTLCFAGAGVFAQTASEIINKNIEAMGGKAKLSQLNSVYEEMTTTIMGQEVPGKVWIVNNKGMRTEMSVMNQNIITVVTRDTGWMVNPMMGNSEPQPLPMAQIKQNLSRMDLRGQLYDYAARGYTATLLGKEAINGKDCYKIKIAKSGEQSFTFLIDPTTYLISRIDADVNANGTNVSTEVDLTDYQKTPEGYVFPHTTTVHVNSGGMEIKSTIDKLTVNPAVDPVLFKKP